MPARSRRRRATVAALTLSALIAWLLAAPSVPRPANARAPSALVVAFAVDVPTLGPRAVSTTQGGSMLGHTYAGLLSTDEQGKLQPRRAERWEILNPTTVRFHLRKN